MKQVGRELGVRYVLEGSVRKAGGRVRITAQLIDAPTGTHLWADRFDGSLEDVFDLQDKVASSVAGVIEPTLQPPRSRDPRRRPTNDLDRLRSLPARLSERWSSARRHLEALRLLNRRSSVDPHYGARPLLGRVLLHAAARLTTGRRTRG